MRCQGKPRLKYQRNDTGPVEYEARGEVLLHVMPPNMVHNKRESVHEREDKEGVRNPPVENLKFLMRNSREQGDPIGLAGGCTALTSVLEKIVLTLIERTKRRACTPNSASPTS